MSQWKSKPHWDTQLSPAGFSASSHADAASLRLWTILSPGALSSNKWRKKPKKIGPKDTAMCERALMKAFS